MILERLTVNNFRVFHGEHAFDLAPRVKYHKKRPIILFGGLNGAGKTTILTAVRLALYGKQSLGTAVASKDYYEYLRKSVHRSKANVTVQPSSTSVQLKFSYASMGILKYYVVQRSWQILKQGVKERLTISENGELLSDLNAEQCQGFLNELIPIGVSDLFFFDGEKIAELAEDTKGEVLGDSIKKLLGLDLLDTLDADLGILIRNETKKSSVEDAQELMSTLENKLAELKQKAADELCSFEQLKPREIEATQTLSRLESELSSKGGAWAATREETIRRQTALTEERKQLEERLREAMADTFPFVLAKEFVLATLEQLKKEAQGKQSRHAAKEVSERIDALKRKVASVFSAADSERIVAMINTEFAPITKMKEDVQILHDVSDRLLGQIETVTQDGLAHTGPLVAQLAERLDEIHAELDRAGKQIARAPEQDQVQPLVAEIRQTNEARTIARAKQKIHLEHQKRYLREAIGVAR
ncbi:MAG: DNA sulfur modification protein DndD, partial [Candidatus Thiodiazotropha endolucinida]|nr:DNA sulfur modification protein DndD [Candidatus Thiodiazotropha taylori]MCW4315297.1 DNA sulfur modification protein DndD [Candidatus Thiodiazotropha taylori]